MAEFLTGSKTATETDEQFQITRNRYDFQIKFSVPAPPPPPPTDGSAPPPVTEPKPPTPLKFTEDYCDHNKTGSFDYLTRSPNLEKDLSPLLHFCFHLELDTNKFECKFWKEFGVHMKLNNLPEGESKYIKVDVKADCPCLLDEKNTGTNTNVTEGKVTEVVGSSPVLLFMHQHYSTKCEHPEEILVTITEFDVSKATLVPLEIQKLIAHRECVKQIAPLVTDWLTPFDVTFRCNDDYDIKAHKSILTVRSPVLKTLLTTDTKEAKTGTIKVKDLTSLAIGVLVNFMYTGDLYENWTDDPEGTLSGAKKYELPHLFQFFDQLLPTACTGRNAVKFLKLAKKHALKNAEKAISTFIEKNFHDVFHASVDLKPGLSTASSSHHHASHSSLKHSLYNSYSAWN